MGVHTEFRKEQDRKFYMLMIMPMIVVVTLCFVKGAIFLGSLAGGYLLMLIILWFGSQ